MFCTKCGAPVGDNVKFCPKCGTPQSIETPVRPPAVTVRPQSTPVQQQQSTSFRPQQPPVQQQQTTGYRPQSTPVQQQQPTGFRPQQPPVQQQQTTGYRPQSTPVQQQPTGFRPQPTPVQQQQPMGYRQQPMAAQPQSKSVQKQPVPPPVSEKVLRWATAKGKLVNTRKLSIIPLAIVILGFLLMSHYDLFGDQCFVWYGRLLPKNLQPAFVLFIINHSGVPFEPYFNVGMYLLLLLLLFPLCLKIRNKIVKRYLLSCRCALTDKSVCCDYKWWFSSKKLRISLDTISEVIVKNSKSGEFGKICLLTSNGKSKLRYIQNAEDFAGVIRAQMEVLGNPAAAQPIQPQQLSAKPDPIIIEPPPRLALQEIPENILYKASVRFKKSKTLLFFIIALVIIVPGFILMDSHGFSAGYDDIQKDFVLDTTGKSISQQYFWYGKLFSDNLDSGFVRALFEVFYYSHGRSSGFVSFGYSDMGVCFSVGTVLIILLLLIPIYSMIRNSLLKDYSSKCRFAITDKAVYCDYIWFLFAKNIRVQLNEIIDVNVKTDFIDKLRGGSTVCLITTDSKIKIRCVENAQQFEGAIRYQMQMLQSPQPVAMQ